MNKKLSYFLSIISLIVMLGGLYCTFGFWFGRITLSPFSLAYVFFDFPSNEGVLSVFLNRLLSGGSWLILTLLIVRCLQIIARRFLFESWSAMHEADKAEYESQFSECGTLLSIEYDEGGALTNAYVTVKTELFTFRCIGRPGAVKIGSRVRRRANKIFLMIDNAEESFRLAESLAVTESPE